MTDGFQPATAAWFAEHFREPTPVQKAGWQAIRAGRNALLVAPTGSGKTLAAFLAAIDRLGQLPDDAPPGVRVLYVSPLKALVYDVERNLRSPLVGIGRVAERVGEHFRSATMAVRTGDTPQRERTEQAKNPPEILVTTPESLYLILGSKAAANLASVETVIVDEIHALAPTKRGAHLA
ncbi:MAG: DEAD/DEAH box helicase, partial [Pseudomonadota bacterium]